MNKQFIKFLSVLLALMTLALCGVGCSTGSEGSSKITANAAISQDTEFGSVVVQIGSEDFKDLGFEYGDSCSLVFSNGKTYTDVPFFSGYYGKTNELAIVDYQGNEYLRACRCSADPLWTEAGCKEDDTITITLQEKGKYLTQQNALDMKYYDDRSKYDSDEIFANFRAISCKNMAQGKFYRGASPVDNQHNRAKTVDNLLRAHGIQYVLDLADTEKKLQGYQQTAGFDSTYYMSLYPDKVALVGLTASYRSEAYKKSLAKSLKEMIKCDGPYYIHCTEGKDRTGFVCILLECAVGCPLADIEANYMKTYENYFCITKLSKPQTYDAVMDTRFYDMLNWLNGVEKSSDLKEANFRNAAKSYLMSGGMTEQEFTDLVTIVTGK